MEQGGYFFSLPPGAYICRCGRRTRTCTCLPLLCAHTCSICMPMPTPYLFPFLHCVLLSCVFKHVPPVCLSCVSKHVLSVCPFLSYMSKHVSSMYPCPPPHILSGTVCLSCVSKHVLSMCPFLPHLSVQACPICVPISALS